MIFPSTTVSTDLIFFSSSSYPSGDSTVHDSAEWCHRGRRRCCERERPRTHIYIPADGFQPLKLFGGCSRHAMQCPAEPRDIHLLVNPLEGRDRDLHALLVHRVRSATPAGSGHQTLGFHP